MTVCARPSCNADRVQCACVPGTDDLWEHLLDAEQRQGATFDQRAETRRRLDRDAVPRRLAAMRWGRDHDRGETAPSLVFAAVLLLGLVLLCGGLVAGIGWAR